MKGRKQKKSEDTWLQRNRAELEGYAGGQTYIWIAENNITNAHQPSNGMLEQILSPSNLNQAYKRVKSNKGSGGVDKMEVAKVELYIGTGVNKFFCILSHRCPADFLWQSFDTLRCSGSSSSPINFEPIAH